MGINRKLNKDIDSLNILTFNGQPTHWQQTSETLTFKLSENDPLIATEYILGLEAGGGTNINDALLEALKIAQEVVQNEVIDSKTQQMIVFLTDGQAATNVHSITKANEDLEVPIYSLAFGDDADFNLLKDISNQNHGFAQRIYESGNSFEQLEDFFDGISGPKLKDVEFEYMYNGQRISPANLTSTHIDHAHGKNEYVIAGNFEPIDSVIDIRLIIKANDGDFLQELIIHPCLAPREGEPRALDINEQRHHICFPSVFWNKTENEEFLERLWAFKRIKYLLEDSDCENAQEDANQSCKEEATELALQYNFVTEVTSLVVEANGEYLDATEANEPVEDYEDYSYHSSYNSFSYASAAAAISSISSISYSRNRLQAFSGSLRTTTTPHTTTTTPH